jgi:hypothetical protein
MSQRINQYWKLSLLGRHDTPQNCVHQGHCRSACSQSHGPAYARGQTYPSISCWRYRHGLYYPRKQATFAAFSDSDWAACYDTQKSQTGVIFTINDVPVHWISIKQPKITLFGTEAEYVAGGQAGRDLTWLTGTCMHGTSRSSRPSAYVWTTNLSVTSPEHLNQQQSPLASTTKELSTWPGAKALPNAPNTSTLHATTFSSKLRQTSSAWNKFPHPIRKPTFSPSRSNEYYSNVHANFFTLPVDRRGVL